MVKTLPPPSGWSSMTEIGLLPKWHLSSVPTAPWPVKAIGTEGWWLEITPIKAAKMLCCAARAVSEHYTEA
jgi:hypothetical protein